LSLLIIRWLDWMWLEWIICTMEWIIFKSSGSRWSLNCNILWENNLSLSFRIINLVLNIIFQVYHVTTTNIDLSELIFVARLDEFISLCNYHKFVNTSISIHMSWHPFRIASLWINFINSFIPWVLMGIKFNISIQ
jgi:hypothetical protein